MRESKILTNEARVASIPSLRLSGLPLCKFEEKQSALSVAT